MGAIVPWNVPLFVTMLKSAPAPGVRLHRRAQPAPETPLDAYLLAEAVQEAGLPGGVLNIVQAGREVGEHIVTHPDVDKISFTGSTVAGKKIAALCGEQLKRCALELGGKSAAIILDDADLATTIPGLMPNTLMNNGEACVAQTRSRIRLAPARRRSVDGQVRPGRTGPGRIPGRVLLHRGPNPTGKAGRIRASPMWHPGDSPASCR